MFRLRKEKSDKLLKVKIGNIDNKKGNISTAVFESQNKINFQRKY